MFKVFPICHAAGFLAAQLVADPLGCCGFCVPCSITILSEQLLNKTIPLCIPWMAHSNGGMWQFFLVKSLGNWVLGVTLKLQCTVHCVKQQGAASR